MNPIPNKAVKRANELIPDFKNYIEMNKNYLITNASFEYLTSVASGELFKLNPSFSRTLSASHQLGQAAEVITTLVWQYSKSIYKFDQTFLDALPEKPPHMEVFKSFPEWGAVVDCSDNDHELANIKMMITEMGMMIIYAKKDGMGNHGRFSFFEESDTMEINPLQAKVLNILAALCMEEPDITSKKFPGSSPHNPSPHRTRNGWELYPVKKTRVWNVGKNLGQKIREQHQKEHQGGKVSPHIRRAHWHSFWTGPRDGERKIVVKWIPPVAVAF